ncbi:styx-b [Symbiodinium natans]|uniref:Styx-b protein n=1 Tax=Symbiodinium natans TaxID=878477 RepID=A0A812SWZ2_9DINO|nr:styx-b [Symbiodinium natans]
MGDTEPFLSVASRNRSIAHLTVFFEGTANTIEPITTQIGLFFALTDAFDVSGGNLGGAPITQPRKMAFDGCGVTDGFCGTICAKGLRRQCAAVRRQVDSLVAELASTHQAPPALRVNAVGLSRGGVACLYLAQALADLHMSTCELSLLLFDPVPGDLLTVAQLDLFGFTNTSACCDVSMCQCLARVLALYPYEPLPAIACHAPVLCHYPDHCLVEEEVTPGCHQGALQVHGLQGPRLDFDSALSFLRIRRWLMECGTPLDHRHLDCTVSVKPMEEYCLRKCNQEVKRNRASVRSSHTAHSHWGASIIRKKVSEEAVYLNQHHKLLCNAAARNEDSDWLLEVEPEMTPFPSGLLCLLSLLGLVTVFPFLVS